MKSRRGWRQGDGEVPLFGLEKHGIIIQEESHLEKVLTLANLWALERIGVLMMVKHTKCSRRLEKL